MGQSRERTEVRFEIGHVGPGLQRMVIEFFILGLLEPGIDEVLEGLDSFRVLP